jgi:hypothetical protein
LTTNVKLRHAFEIIKQGFPGRLCNPFNARVEDIAYLGGDVRLRLTGAAEFTAKRPDRAAGFRRDNTRPGWNAEDAPSPTQKRKLKDKPRSALCRGERRRRPQCASFSSPSRPRFSPP